MISKIEVTHFSRKRGWKTPCIELLNWPDATLAFACCTEQFIDAVTQRRNRAHAGNDNSTLMHFDSVLHSHYFRNSSHLNTAAATWPNSVMLILMKHGFWIGRGSRKTATGQAGSGSS